MLRRLAVGASPRRTFVRAAVLAVVCLVLFRFVLRPVRAEGPSMEPTVRNGSLHLVYSLAYLGQAPRRGDLVTIRGVTGSLMYMKRVLAVPGDRVAFRRGALYLNGTPTPEPYVVFHGTWSMPEQHLGADEYFVAGDNRHMQRTSHTHGFVDRRQITGRLLW